MGRGRVVWHGVVCYGRGVVVCAWCGTRAVVCARWAPHLYWIRLSDAVHTVHSLRLNRRVPPGVKQKDTLRRSQI